MYMESLDDIIKRDETQEWRYNGRLHRTDNDMPAIINVCFHKKFYQVAKMYGWIVVPISCDCIYAQWWQYGSPSRNNNLPTSILMNGTEIWGQAQIFYGQWTGFHRYDGPAIIRNDGTLEWYYLGQKYTPIMKKL